MLGDEQLVTQPQSDSLEQFRDQTPPYYTNKAPI